METERVDTLGLDRADGLQLLVLVVSDHREDERLTVAVADRVTHVGEVLGGNAVDADDPVVSPQARRRRGRLGDDVPDLPRGVGGDPEHVDRREQDDREHEVRAGAGGDHGEALPGPLPPVRVRTERVVELGQPAVGRAARLPGEGGVTQRLLELRERMARLLECALPDEALHALDVAQQARLLIQRGPEVHIQIGRRRPVHPRDLHVAAEGDRAEPVLDPVPGRLQQRGWESDVELPRPHANPARGEEVARLVNQDQEREAEDRDENTHATADLSARRRASLSASTRSSRSLAAATSTSARVSSTVDAIPRNGIRPSRKAATATSLAALNAQG